MRAVTQVKPEQASKVTMRMPTRPENGEGRGWRVVARQPEGPSDSTLRWTPYSLVHKVYSRTNLAFAWERVRRNKGARGIDGEELEPFEACLEEKLDCKPGRSTG